MTPYVPVPDTNGEEWDRLEPASALDALVEVILHGEYNNIIDGERRTKDGMELRGAALGIFQVLTPEVVCLVQPSLKHAISRISCRRRKYAKPLWRRWSHSPVCLHIRALVTPDDCFLQAPKHPQPPYCTLSRPCPCLR